MARYHLTSYVSVCSLCVRNGDARRRLLTFTCTARKLLRGLLSATLSPTAALFEIRFPLLLFVKAFTVV